MCTGPSLTVSAVALDGVVLACIYVLCACVQPEYMTYHGVCLHTFSVLGAPDCWMALLFRVASRWNQSVWMATGRASSSFELHLSSS